MDHIAETLISFVSVEHQFWGLVVLGLSAAIEYIFPPFPGDTITLFGAFLITAKGWSFALVFSVTLAGSALGGMADFWLGNWLRKRAPQGPPGRVRRKIEVLVEKFRRHGELYLVINRFLPGIRSLFFVAAGLAKMRPARVLLWTLVSAALWNLALIGVGSLVGKNLDELIDWFRTYALVAWIVVGAVIVLALARWWLARRRHQAEPE